MKVALYPGSFDPITNGHMDVLKRAVSIFDKVIVLVAINPDKKGRFSIEDRVEMIKEAVSEFPNVEVDSYKGLTVRYAKEHGATHLIRGLRAVTDFEYEVQQAQMLKHIAPDLETVFILTGQEYYFVSSSGIRELAMFHGDIHGLVPECVEEAVKRRIMEIEAKS